MKRAKGFIILAAIASLAFGSVNAFGAETASTTVNAPTAKAGAATEKTYDALPVKAVTFQNDRSEFLGTYPEITDYDVLNKKIADTIFKEYLVYGSTAQDDFGKNNYLISYKVTEEGRFATITVSRAYYWGYTDVASADATTVYYIDKETQKAITEAEYKKLVEAAKEAAATPAKEEKVDNSLVYAPLDEVSKILGFSMKSTKAGKDEKITLNSKDLSVAFTFGTNEYVVGKEVVKLDAAPILVDNVVCVPTAFFEKILGAKVVTDDKGIINISIGDKKAQIEVRYQLKEDQASTEPKTEATEPAKAVETDEIKATDAAKEAAAPVEDIIVIPLRTYVEQLGYTIAPNGKSAKGHDSFKITKGDFTAELTIGENTYKRLTETVTLDSEPIVHEGSAYVPISFFKDILGVDVVDNGDDTFTFADDAAAAE